MKKKTNKKVSEGGIGVILEDIDSKFDLVLEGHSVLDKKIDKISDDLGEFKKETGSSLRSIFEYLSRIDEELQFIKSEIADLKTRLSAKADLARLEALEKQVQKLEVELVKQRGLRRST